MTSESTSPLLTNSSADCGSHEPESGDCLGSSCVPLYLNSQKNQVDSIN